MNIKNNIVWFKRDLRLSDHGPIQAASKSGYILPLYIIEPELWLQPDSSPRHWYFIHDSLNDLDNQLKKHGGRLIIRIGDALSVLENLRQTLGNFALYSHQETGNSWTFKRDIKVAKWCKENSIIWTEFQSNSVIRGLKSRDNWSKLRNDKMAEAILKEPESIDFIQDISSDDLPLKDHKMFGIPISNSNYKEGQDGGRKTGINVLNSFLKERGRKYMLTISKPGISARHCSRLSAHIAYGTLSVKEINYATKKKIQSLQNLADEDAKYFRFNLSAFLSRLAWRCHFVQKLEQKPDIETNCMHPAFEGMREHHFREDYFECWKAGKTGYPIIDACMRSLIENGWINFRMRAMLVSFASYDLWLDWRQTAPYLARLFTDYEPGIHYSQFQMQSGVTGINAIRIYNPVKQSLDHDPKGKFIRRYLPELKDIPDAFIHEPWRMKDMQNQYFKPIVNHDEAIKYARKEISKYWRESGFKEQAKEVQNKLGSRKKSSKVVNSKVKKDSKQMELEF